MPYRVKKLLIAEDDPDDRALFKAAAEEICPEVKLTFTENGEGLLNLLEEFEPDAVILDLNMPKKGGLQTLEEIRATHAYDELPVVILSTSNNSSEMKDCLAAGADRYFFKPLSYDGLKEIIQKMCSGKLIG